MSYCGNYICDTDISNWPSGTTDAQKEAAIRRAEEIIEAILHTHYYPKAFDIELNGNNKNRLFIPLKANVLTVTAVYVWGELLDPTWYTWDVNSIYINVSSGIGVSNIELAYRLSEIEVDGLFPHGYNNIHILGTYGSATVPQWIKDLAKILVQDINDPSLYTHYLKSETIGNYSYSMGGVYDVKGVTGIKEADDLLRLFKRGKCLIMAP